MNSLYDNKNLFIALTYQCNAFCKKCMTRCHIKRGIEMEPALIDKIVYKLGLNQYTGIVSVGSGEPLLYPRLSYFFSSVMSINDKISLRILSNGVRFSEELPAEYFTSRCKWGITMDGFSQESLYGFQKGVQIDKVKFQIKKVVERYGASCLYLNYTLHNRNYHELADFCTFAAELGIHDVYVTELKIYEGYEEQLFGYKLEHNQAVKDSLAHAKEILVKNGISDKGLQIEKTSWSCGCFRNRRASPIIDVDGTVTFCSGREDVAIGNILDANIEERWRDMYEKLSRHSERWCRFCHARQLENGCYTLPKTSDRDLLVQAHWGKEGIDD